MIELNLKVFPKGWFDRYVPKGAELQSVELESDGTMVGYGVPEQEHNCDEMGCPTIGHVLFVLKGATAKFSNSNPSSR